MRVYCVICEGRRGLVEAGGRMGIFQVNHG